MKRHDSPSHDFYIKNIAHLMRYKSDQRLAPYDITESQARLLGHIYGAQRSEQEVSRRYLSRAMQISGPSVTSLLNNLERKGFLLRCSGSEDGRTMSIELSQKAITLLHEMSDILNVMAQDLLMGFSEEEKRIFLMFLKRTYDNLGIDSHL